MGYYTNMDIGGRIRPDKVKELKAELRRIKKLSPNERPDYYVSFLFDMMIKKYRMGHVIEWDNYDQQWDCDGEFIRFIVKYLDPQDIIFTDDSSSWGYRLRADGTVAKLSAHYVEDGELW